MGIKIITNNVPRDVIGGFTLTQDERNEFDYYSRHDLDDASFMRYRGELYDLSEFTPWDNPASPTRQQWDGFRSDSYSSGIAIRYVDDFERVICALVLS